MDWRAESTRAECCNDQPFGEVHLTLYQLRLLGSGKAALTNLSLRHQQVM
jgi:hypothetical protein